MSRIAQYVSWATKQLQNQGQLLSIRNSKSSGYGLYANRDITRGTVLLQVKDWRPLSCSTAIQSLLQSKSQPFQRLLQLSNSPSFPPKQQELLVSSASLALHAIELRKSNNSPYINFLCDTSYPANPNAMPHPLSMSASQLSYLKGSSFQPTNFYSKIASTIFPNCLESAEQFKWAIGLILSRAISPSSAGEHPLTFVPVLDFANHSLLSVNSEHKFDKVSDSFSLVSSKDIKRDEEVCICYGEQRDTNYLMRVYGFMDPNHFKFDRFPMQIIGNGTSKTIQLNVDQILTVDVLTWEELLLSLSPVAINPSVAGSGSPIITSSNSETLTSSANQNLDEETKNLIATDLMKCFLDFFDYDLMAPARDVLKTFSLNTSSLPINRLQLLLELATINLIISSIKVKLSGFDIPVDNSRSLDNDSSSSSSTRVGQSNMNNQLVQSALVEQEKYGDVDVALVRERVNGLMALIDDNDRILANASKAADSSYIGEKLASIPHTTGSGSAAAWQKSCLTIVARELSAALRLWVCAHSYRAAVVQLINSPSFTR